MRGENGQGARARATLVANVWRRSLSFDAGAKQGVSSRLARCLSCVQGMDIGETRACLPNRTSLYIGLQATDPRF